MTDDVQKKPTEIYYDIEGTGLDPIVEILQIGLIATDKNQNEVATEKLEGRLSPWELPSPGALLTTGFELDDLRKRENSNFDMMEKLAGWIKQQNARGPITFIGYSNSIYDERVMAQNFYQNLLPADVTTGAAPNGQLNGRADVNAMVRLAWLYMPGALKLDIKNGAGTPSMSLKNVARQNGVDLGDEDAHDAFNDIRATLGVARVIKKVAPQVWEQSMKLSTVAGTDKFIADNELFTASEFEYGKPHVSSVMTALTAVGGAQEALFDLRQDPAQYLNMSVQELKAVFLSDKNGNPFLTVDKSNAPMLMPMDQSGAILTEQDNLAIYKQRADVIRANPAFLAKVAEASKLAQHAAQLAHPMSDKLPEALIDKPIAPEVRAKLDAFAKEFHDAPDWHARAILTRGFHERFKTELAADPSLNRFEKLAARVIYEAAPQEVSAARIAYMKQSIARRMLDPNPKAPYMTIARARTELAQIRHDLTKPGSKWAEAKGQDIDKLADYYDHVEKDCAKLVPGYVIGPASAPPGNDTPQKSPAAAPAARSKI